MRWPRLAPAATMRAGEGVAPPTEVAMKMSIARCLGAFALLFPLLLPLALPAQSLPKPKELYFDGDGSPTAPLVLLEGSEAASRERMPKAMQGHGRNAALATRQAERRSGRVWVCPCASWWSTDRYKT